MPGVVGEPLLPALRHATATGDPGAADLALIDALYRAHRDELAALAAAITLDRELAMEVVHDVFVGLQRHVGNVANPAGYLHRSVVQRSISVLRRRRTSSRHPLPRPAVVLTPEIDETWQAVTALPVRERAVVVLRFWRDLSEADIADTLGWPVGTVKSTLHRALRRLKEQLR